MLFASLGIVFVIAILLSGCSSNTETVITLQHPKPTSNGLTTENENFKITFEPVYLYNYSLKQIHVTLENKTTETIKINWDEASFITPNKVASRAVPGNVSFIDVSKSIPPTVIPNGSKADVVITPEKNVDKSEAYISDINYENNTSMSIVIPIKIGESVKEYRYDFEIRVYKIS